MNKKKMEFNLDILKQIQKVEVPPFLFTRIQQQIDNGYSLKFSKRLAWSLGISFLIVLIMNAAVLTYGTKKAGRSNDLAQEMGLMPKNSLYK